jgi:Cdc6-like AAA superfamily ATPase
LREEALAYARTHEGHPLVVVIDNINRLAKEDPKMLELLQDFAKNSADAGTIRIVFVASEGNAPGFLQGKRLS